MDDIDSYLDALASSAPTPGGGSAAALVGAAGASLVAMVARITLESPRREAYHGAARPIAEEADRLRTALRGAGVRDEAAYAAVTRAQQLPRDTDPERALRAQALETALAHAADEPLAAATLARDVLALCARALALEHRGLASDVGCAAEFALASLRASAYNVRVNHRFMKDQATIARQAARLEELEGEADETIARVRGGVDALLSG
ncbi:MAG TPA: cyclodeaminase/cyclohydrolase family protein [Candidatus Binatia bacterium]|nr:cyclodeaminase/cyclohydrolase family protein [Candidatus Binatia bacterium]